MTKVIISDKYDFLTLEPLTITNVLTFEDSEFEQASLTIGKIILSSFGDITVKVERRPNL